MNKIKTSIICISFLYCISCSNNSNLKVNMNQPNESSDINLKEINKGKFEYGTWRIDSVAEDKIIKNRLIKDSNIQVFNFRKDGVFSTMEVTSKKTSDYVFGNWKVENDSIFIFIEKGNLAMSYGFQINGSCLTLNGNFEISSNIKKKPSFYLSKYVE